MGIMVENDQEKSQLAKEICELSTRAAACANLHHHHGSKSSFINWYLVLGVDETADADGIRRQYHRLALQLHPDKNKHSMAEAAFKLVSEAYFCLSDNARRAAFDLERKNISCTKCNTVPITKKHPPTHTNVKIQTPYQETIRFNRIQTSLKELRTRFREEALTIEKCLIANTTASRRESVKARGTRELPIFNPSDYQHKGYPHHRTINPKMLQDLRAEFVIGNRCLHSRGTNSFPIFQCRSESVSYMSRRASKRDK